MQIKAQVIRPDKTELYAVWKKSKTELYAVFEGHTINTKAQTI